jgi:hypothetical protein
MLTLKAGEGWTNKVIAYKYATFLSILNIDMFSVACLLISMEEESHFLSY